MQPNFGRFLKTSSFVHKYRIENGKLNLNCKANNTRLRYSKQKSFDEIPISFLVHFGVSTHSQRFIWPALGDPVSVRFQTSLISEREDGIDEEHRPVDDGQRSLGDGQPATLGLEAAFPGLQDQDAGRDEHGASQQAEEQIDLLVDRVAQEMTSKQTNQDDRVTDEGTGNEQDGHLVGFTQAFVVQYHAADGESQLQEFQHRQSANGHCFCLDFTGNFT